MRHRGPQGIALSCPSRNFDDRMWNLWFKVLVPSAYLSFSFIYYMPMAIWFSIETVCTWTMSTRFNLGWFFRMYWLVWIRMEWKEKGAHVLFGVYDFYSFFQTLRKWKEEGKEGRFTFKSEKKIFSLEEKSNHNCLKVI